MAQLALPDYEIGVHARFAFIDPFCMDWEGVSVSSLKDAFQYLTVNWTEFEKAVLADLSSGFHCSFSIRSIFKTLKKFTRWFAKCQRSVDSALSSVDAAMIEKAKLATNIVEVIEILWIPFLKECSPVREYLGKQRELLTADERILANRKVREEDNRDKEMRTILDLIRGESDEERLKKFDALYEVLNGMKGKTVAVYLQAAIELKWLIDMPEFSLMKKYWGVAGTQGAVSKNYSISAGSNIDDVTVSNAKAKLSDLLCLD